ncbi:hypothetical protein R9C00_09710 [Flammeovirgaceae bacterium SG7u.111]|nr:hypothetical protein [Flammeovirgaceae bacterium SG7u.132]WPO37726.1 hypothetical protein R9C00_09710 [Flammeovirgaceae bacterium SG7u.111]
MALEKEFYEWFKEFKAIYTLTPEPKQLAGNKAKDVEKIKN